MKLAILNTSIVTSDGNYTVTTIPTYQAINICKSAMDSGYGIDSAIGHEATAAILTTILGTDIPVNRQLFSQQVGQYALVFKLNGRPGNGVELTREQIEEIGFTFKLMKRTN